MADKDCFVIAPIGEPESDIRKRSDQILKHVISPALKECGYKATRADQISEPGMITSQVIQHIVDDPLVVADSQFHQSNHHPLLTEEEYFEKQEKGKHHSLDQPKRDR